MSLLTYYPEPFEQRFPLICTYRAQRVYLGQAPEEDLWQVELPNTDIWWLHAVSESAAIKQARQLWAPTRSGAIGGETR